MLRQMAREIQQLRGQRSPRLNQRILRIKPGFSETLQQIMTVIEPLMRLRDAIHNLRIDTQRLARFTQCATRPIRRHRRRNRRTITPIFTIDVLDDFLAPLMLEVDIDIRRFAALFTDEPLEQHVAARRVHFGDAEAITHR